MRVQRCVAVALATASMAMVSVAAADEPTAADKAAAEQLFRDGKKAMDAKDYPRACEAFQASQEAAPAVSTLANLANCRELNRQLASAWSLFLEAAKLTRGDKQQASLHKTMTERAAKLEPRLSYLTVSVPDESRVDGLVIVRNGEPLDPGVWNRAIPVDGGDYVIGGRAPGHEEWSTTVHVVDEGGRVSVDVPRFKEATKLVPKQDPGAGGEPGDDVATTSVSGRGVEDRPAPGGTLTGTRKVAVGLGVIGLGGVALGAVFGSQMNGLRDDALAICPEATCARADEANALREDAEGKALRANVSFGIGAAAIVGAAVLWFTGGPAESVEPPRAALSPTVRPGYAGLSLGGSF